MHTFFKKKWHVCAAVITMIILRSVLLLETVSRIHSNQTLIAAGSTYSSQNTIGYWSKVFFRFRKSFPIRIINGKGKIPCLWERFHNYIVNESKY